VTVYLIRHAKAGSPHDWEGDDRLRPLTKTGHRQADALAQRIGDLGVTGLISSPYRRCVETLQPLARSSRLTISTDPSLGEGRNFDAVLKLLNASDDGTVLCSHGDVIPETIAALQRRGVQMASAPDWRKASVWVLDRDATGEFVIALAWPPPEVG
jgi:8-oxo-dGTP diphosphatase